MKNNFSRKKGKLIILGMLGIFLAEEAAAIVGRPLTPVSVAGVSRRTVRRAQVRSTTPRR
jgi:hypothetical protein